MAQPLSQRLAKFRENFKKVLGPKRQGYGELGQLEEPLVGDDEHEGQGGSRVDYARQHGVAPPSQGRQQQGHPMGGTLADVPSQGDDMRQLAALGREAAEILWEMAAMNDSGDAAKEMLDKTAQLQAQLRGMIGDYHDSDEEALAGGLEVYDLLTNTLEEYSGKSAAPHPASGAPSSSVPTSSGGAVPQLRPPPDNPFQAGSDPLRLGQTAPGQKPKGEEAPLISFD
ncbi:hypothetical protein WJX73_003788 [Symbiochloris irregularis]|uniref:Uncharacterized protein n=1 Tax=Symbiochloris irregularis TaxID=706552 RepID=A0AAW1P577_9CHLO